VIAPYYSKVNEYLFGESRDLWEYALDLEPSQVEWLVEHLWELVVNGSFDYFYLDENCSFHLLSLLEIAQPQWHLTRSWDYVIQV